MTIESDSVVALIEKPDAFTQKSDAFTQKSDEVKLLIEQVAVLSEQVAVLSTNQSRGVRPSRGRPHCFHCNQVGHLQHDSRNHKCFNCGRLGHLSKDCWHQGNNNGAPVQGNRRPYQ